MIDLVALLPVAFRPARPHASGSARRPRASFRPGIDALEGRLVLSHMMPSPTASAAAHVHVTAIPSTRLNLPVAVTGINVTGITQDAATGVLNLVGTATGTILGKTFTTDLTGTITPAKNPKSCPVLDLHLSPISLSVLGLNVNTSNICLNITARHNGGLLGNLLCDGLSNVVTTAGSGATGALTSATTQLNTLLGNQQVLNVANRTLSQAPARLSAFTPAQGTTCPVLNLAVGPVNLNLLGLRVKLDNCQNGPVRVAITATKGGGLLGDLVCGLSGNLTGRSLIRQVSTLLQNITSTPVA